VTGLEIAFLVVAGVLAGVANSIAGGGSLVSFPALVAVGMPTLEANVTNNVAVWPGFIGGAVGYRAEIASQRERLRREGLTTVLGAVAGAAVLLLAPEAVFDAIVPVLVLGGSLLLAAQPRIARLVQARADVDAEGHKVQLHVALFLAAAYGAYFGGGMGVIVLAVLGIFIADDLQRLNGMKAAIGLIVRSVALVAFGLFGPVDWLAVAIIAPASLAGGYLGAGFARRLSQDGLRNLVVVFGLVVAAWLFLR
jgi:uncharacterized protein